MMYYADHSKELRPIVTPYGKYQSCRMAMGLKTAPDEAQAVIEKVLGGLDVDVYIDDIAIFNDTYDEHMELVSKALSRLESKGFKVNPLKCKWAVTETDFLGYWMTPTGIKPWRKKT
jgi:Reverse transcriptase (RNA-dependent DNA polymerase)